MVTMDMIDDKLWELQKACNRYSEIDCLSKWVLYAIHGYIYSNKATRKFEEDFINYPVKKFEYLIKKCLNGDRSDDGIIKTAKRILRQHK